MKWRSAAGGLALVCCTGAASPEKLNFVAGSDASAAEQQAVIAASTIVNAVVGSDCFRKFMADRALTETNGRSAPEVAVQLQQVFGQVPVAFYFRCMKAAPDCREPTTAMAYRQPPDMTVHLNRAYYDVTAPGFDLYEMAGSLAHEALGHSLGGYDHSFDWTPERDFTVPYSISGASRHNGDAFQYCRAELKY